MKLPYGYILLARKSLYMKKKQMLSAVYLSIILLEPAWEKLLICSLHGIPSPTGNLKWTRTAVAKLLANEKCVPIVGVKVYLDAQFEKNHRCNVDYDRAGHPRKAARYQSTSLEMK